jgi:hypothetical protein
MIDWLLFNANFSNISTISWRERNMFIYYDNSLFNKSFYTIYLNIVFFILNDIFPLFIRSHLYIVAKK